MSSISTNLLHSVHSGRGLRLARRLELFGLAKYLEATLQHALTSYAGDQRLYTSFILDFSGAPLSNYKAVTAGAGTVQTYQLLYEQRKEKKSPKVLTFGEYDSFCIGQF